MLESFVDEFKKFALRGNMIDLAIGVVIGAAFGKTIDSLVKDILMPPLGLLMGNADFSNLFVLLKEGVSPAPYPSLAAAQQAGAVTLNIGLFLNTVISFLIIAFAIFIVVKILNKLKEKTCLAEKAAEEAKTKHCPYCMSTIDINAVKCAFCTADLK